MIVMVDVVAVAELTIVVYLFGAVDVSGSSCIVDLVGSRLSMHAVLSSVIYNSSCILAGLR
jgi:hypothetical protein